MWITRFVVEGERASKIAEVFAQIRERDETFDFEIREYKNGFVAAIVKSKDRNVAFKRGVWLRSKVEHLKDCGFEVLWDANRAGGRDRLPARSSTS